MSVDHWALHILNLDNGKLNSGSWNLCIFFKYILSSLAEECALPPPLFYQETREVQSNGKIHLSNPWQQNSLTSVATARGKGDRRRRQAKGTCRLAHPPRKNHVTANTTLKIYSARWKVGQPPGLKVTGMQEWMGRSTVRAEVWRSWQQRLMKALHDYMWNVYWVGT